MRARVGTELCEAQRHARGNASSVRKHEDTSTRQRDTGADAQGHAHKSMHWQGTDTDDDRRCSCSTTFRDLASSRTERPSNHQRRWPPLPGSAEDSRQPRLDLLCRHAYPYIKQVSGNKGRSALPRDPQEPGMHRPRMQPLVRWSLVWSLPHAPEAPFSGGSDGPVDWQRGWLLKYSRHAVLSDGLKASIRMVMTGGI